MQTIKQLVSDVSERLGYKFPLKAEQVLAMYEMCRFDQAWQLDEPSAWCVVSIISFKKLKSSLEF